MITSAGIGSGLDIENIITQLVTAEGQPAAQRLDRREAGYQAELSGLGQVNSALSQFRTSVTTLQNFGTSQPRVATVSDSTVFTASATGSAVSASYQIQVNAIAEAHRVSTAGVATSSTATGTGTLTITTNSKSFNVVVNTTNNTLAGIRSAINSAQDNTGVSATIVNVDNGTGGTESRLVLSATNTGTLHNITVSADDDDNNDTDTSGLSIISTANLSVLNAAVNASISIDGQTVTRASNTISDAIDGVSLTLQKADVGVNKTLTVGLDKAAVRTAVSTFVSTYNSLQGTLNQLTFYNATNNTSGALLGDATLRNVRNQISQQLSQTVAAVSGTFNSLPSIGIVSDASGNFQLNNTVFNAALDSNFNDINTLFADGTNGIAVKLRTLLDSYLGSSGILRTRTDGLQTSISSISDSRQQLSDRLIRIEARFRTEFTALDTLVANFQSTANFLTQQLANLPGFTRARNNS